MRLDWDYRVADLLQLAESFTKETKYPITYSPEGATEYLWRLLNDPNTSVFIDYFNDICTGGIIVYRANQFQHEYFGYVLKMYVHPKFRRTGASRRLMQEAVQWFDENDCVVSFETAIAGIGEDKLYINLLKKFGYVPEGTAFIRYRREL